MSELKKREVPIDERLEDGKIPTDSPIVKERSITCIFVSDGIYKYVYDDTGEDVV